MNNGATATHERPQNLELPAHQGSPLSGKRVIVTGGTTGIGRAVAKMLTSAGANVLIYGRHEAELQDALSYLEGGNGKAHGIIADQAETSEVEKVFEEADKVLGGLDILINNAAIGGGSVVESDMNTIEYTIDSNLTGYLACCHHAVKRMKQVGQGDIINIGSMSAKGREKGSDLYVATKAGVDGFTDALRKQVVEDNIRVLLVEPGLVGTDMTKENHPIEEQRQMEERGEMLIAEDIAECVRYMLTQPRRCDVIHVRIQPHKSED